MPVLTNIAPPWARRVGAVRHRNGGRVGGRATCPEPLAFGWRRIGLQTLASSWAPSDGGNSGALASEPSVVVRERGRRGMTSPTACMLAP